MPDDVTRREIEGGKLVAEILGKAIMYSENFEKLPNSYINKGSMEKNNHKIRNKKQMRKRNRQIALGGLKINEQPIIE